MKKFLGAVFAAALVLIPAFGVAKTTYQRPYLACAAVYPVVSWGNAGRFNVITSENGPFTWVANDEDYSVYKTGSQFITPLTHLGTEQITVVWGSQRASCYVNVVAAPGFGEPYAAPVFTGSGYGPNVTLTSVVYPLLPNTGFEPQTLAAFAFAVVLLVGSTIALYPHAKKAFAIVTR